MVERHVQQLAALRQCCAIHCGGGRQTEGVPGCVSVEHGTRCCVRLPLRVESDSNSSCRGKKKDKHSNFFFWSKIDIKCWVAFVFFNPCHSPLSLTSGGHPHPRPAQEKSRSVVKNSAAFRIAKKRRVVRGGQLKECEIRVCRQLNSAKIGRLIIPPRTTKQQPSKSQTCCEFGSVCVVPQLK